MKRQMAGALVLATSMLVGAAGVAAQPEAEAPRRMRAPAGVEALMRMREELALTEEQIASLDVIRREAVERRTATRAEMAEMRSQLDAGQIRRSELMAFMEERQDAMTGVAEQQRERVDAILTDEQRQTVQEMRGRAEAFERGRASARPGGRAGLTPGRGLRGGRGGMRRPGMGRFDRQGMRPRGIR
jgi:hypothetical protein